MSDLPPVTFTHIGIKVTDLDKMAGFYCRVFGFLQSDRGYLDMDGADIELAFLTRDPKIHHQIVLLKCRPKEQTFSTVDQISLQVDGLPEVRKYWEALQIEKDISSLRSISHGNAWSLYMFDPEGNRIELYCDTPWYTPQPIRGKLDFSRTDEEIYAETERMVRQSEESAPVKEWQQSIADKLGFKNWRPEN
jgi:catechol 2,3-dioxygenase-like lactoylglutathione lyase family enzyme